MKTDAIVAKYTLELSYSVLQKITQWKEQNLHDGLMMAICDRAKKRFRFLAATYCGQRAGKYTWRRH